MLQTIIISLVVAACVASPSPCLDGYTQVSNPCLNNPMGQVYFPHPYDQTKFVQCDQFQNMYVTQCPGDSVFSTATFTCRPRAQFINNIQYPLGSILVGNNNNNNNNVVSNNNPCTAAALAVGQMYFPVAGDSSKFIECDMTGHANIMPCAAGLVWDQNKLTCVFSVQANGSVKPLPSNGSTGTGIFNPNGIYLGNHLNTGNGNGALQQVLNGLANPCTSANIQAKKLYWPHPDATKFIQCDLWGQAFVVNCPAGRVWNQFYETCANAFVPYIVPRNVNVEESQEKAEE